MLFARIILSIQIVALTALGLAYFIRPEEMASFSGALLMGNAAVTEVRAYYGGLQLGLAAYLAMALLCCARRCFCWCCCTACWRWHASPGCGWMAARSRPSISTRCCSRCSRPLWPGGRCAACHTEL